MAPSIAEKNIRRGEDSDAVTCGRDRPRCGWCGWHGGRSGGQSSSLHLGLAPGPGWDPGGGWSIGALPRLPVLLLDGISRGSLVGWCLHKKACRSYVYKIRG